MYLSDIHTDRQYVPVRHTYRQTVCTCQTDIHTDSMYLPDIHTYRQYVPARHTYIQTVCMYLSVRQTDSMYLPDIQTDRQTVLYLSDRRTDRQTDRQYVPDRQTDRQTDRQYVPDRQTDRQTVCTCQTDRQTVCTCQTDRQTDSMYLPDIRTDRQTDSTYLTDRQTDSMYLPDRVRMLPSLSCGVVDWVILPFLEVVYGNSAIVQTHGHKERMLGVNVQTHHSRSGRVHIPRREGQREREGICYQSCFDIRIPSADSSSFTPMTVYSTGKINILGQR